MQEKHRLSNAISKGVCDAGADILEIGLAGTEEIYAGVCTFSADAGIVVTASHNPIEYNGIKFVKQGSQPLSDLEFDNIRRLAEENIFVSSFHSGLVTDKRVEGRNATPIKF